MERTNWPPSAASGLTKDGGNHGDREFSPAYLCNCEPRVEDIRSADWTRATGPILRIPRRVWFNVREISSIMSRAAANSSSLPGEAGCHRPSAVRCRPMAAHVPTRRVIRVSSWATSPVLIVSILSCGLVNASPTDAILRLMSWLIRNMAECGAK